MTCIFVFIFVYSIRLSLSICANVSDNIVCYVAACMPFLAI